jgi:hypothetical protein
LRPALDSRWCRDREPNLDLAAFSSTCHLEARVVEDAEHGGVLGQYLGDELLDPGLCRPRRELLE